MDGSFSGKKHDPNCPWGIMTAAPASHSMAKGVDLEYQPSVEMEQTIILTPQDDTGSVDLLFTGDPSPGAWLCTVDMDPEDGHDQRIVGIVSQKHARFITQLRVPFAQVYSNLASPYGGTV
jgi:hypothetical protein